MLWLRVHPKLLVLPAAEVASEEPAAVAMARPAMDPGEVLARPLFNPTRRPAVPPPVEAPPPAVAAPPPPVDIAQIVSLAGVAVSTERIALLRRSSQPQLLRVHEGDLIETWTVERIAADGVLFSNGDLRTTLSFPKLGGVSPLPAPPSGAADLPGEAGAARLFSPGG
jgi:hypothetical protein